MPIAWFVDGAYLHNAFVRPRGFLDYKGLRAVVEERLGDRIVDACYFSADDRPPRAEGFHNLLSQPLPAGAGMTVKVYWYQSKELHWPRHLGGGPVVHPDSGVPFILKTQKAVDVGLAFHLMRSFHAHRWDKLALAAGDADFHEPVSHLVREEGVALTLVGVENSLSQELRLLSQDVIRLDEAPLASRLTMR